MSAPETADEPTVEEMMAELRALNEHTAERHGIDAALMLTRLIAAFFGRRISEEEFLALGRDVYHRGEWRAAAARLDALAAGTTR